MEPKLIDALKQKNPDVESEINSLSDSVDKIDQKDKLNQNYIEHPLGDMIAVLTLGLYDRSLRKI